MTLDFSLSLSLFGPPSLLAFFSIFYFEPLFYLTLIHLASASTQTVHPSTRISSFAPVFVSDSDFLHT